MTIAMAGYVCNDALIKLAVDDLDLFQSIFIRGICISLFLATLARLRGELVDIGQHIHPPVLLRMTMEMVAPITIASTTPLAVASVAVRNMYRLP